MLASIDRSPCNSGLVDCCLVVPCNPAAYLQLQASRKATILRRDDVLSCCLAHHRARRCFYRSMPIHAPT